ncbi:MAG: TIGR02221 family CRISPR-associated protein [Lachnospiraceae bacterium]|nr:TIGR02221 family CRISPR-associated protein [Lachnospiraceae bacterium]
MRTHLISVLGNRLYQPTYYGAKLKKEEFFQCTLAKKFEKELKNNGRITVLLTTEAKEMNWQNRKFSGNEAGRSFGDGYVIREGDIHEGLESKLKKIVGDDAVHCITLSDCSDHNLMLKEISDKIIRIIEDGDEVIFDITNGFRSIPLIAVSALRYAKTIKRCKLKGIYYGAFDAIQDGVVPIIDTSLYNDIIDWSFAAEQLKEYGNAIPMKDTYEDLHCYSDNYDYGTSLGKVIKATYILTEAIKTSRLSDDTEGIEANIRDAYWYYRKCYNDWSNDGFDYADIPLKEMLKCANRKFRVLYNKKGYELGLVVARLQMEFKMVNQTYVCLHETMKMYIRDILLKKFENYDNLSELMFMVKKKGEYEEKKRAGEDMYYSDWQYFTEIDRDSQEYYSKLKEDRKILAKKVFLKINSDLAFAKKQVSSKRNNLSHCGILEGDNKEIDVTEFQKSLDKLYGIVCNAINDDINGSLG